MQTTRRNFLQKGLLLGSGISVFATKLFAAKNRRAQEIETYDLFDAIKNRRSVRHFQSTPVPDAHLKLILQAANYAPTPRNRQGWKFVVIRDRRILDEIKEACVKQSGESGRQYYTDFLSAPVYIAIYADQKTRNPVNDFTAGALAAENLLLAARALGYGTVYSVNSISEAITDPILKVPEQYKRVCFTPVGIPTEWPETPPKRDVEEGIVYDTF